MCELVKKLGEIADELIAQQHATINKSMTDEEREKFVNHSLTIQTHSQYLQTTMALTS